nr:transposase [Spirulina subsalsa]
MTLRGYQLTLSCIDQQCNVCKHIRKTNRTKSRFHCRNCGHRDHSDGKAAKNHRKDDYILSTTLMGTVEQAAVNLPDVITLAG